MLSLSYQARSIKFFGRHSVGRLASPRAAFFLGEPFFWLFGLRRKRRDIDLFRAKRVLVVRLDQIGDVVITTPLIRELRRNLPDGRITLLVSPQVRNLVELCPYVDEVLTYDWNTNGNMAWHRQQLQRHGRALRLAWKHLWQRRFDLAIVPRWDTDWYHAIFVAYFSGACRRVAYSENIVERKQQLNRRYDYLLTHVLNDIKPKHEVERNLDVIRFLGGAVLEDRLEFWMGEEDAAFTKEVMTVHGVHRDDLLVAFGPGAGTPKRLWPLACFVELGAWLKREYHARIVVVGGRGEERLGQELRRQVGESVIDVVGTTTLRQTGALLRSCDLYVGNDAGPMHLAAAAGVPVVEISCHPLTGSPLHANSPLRFGPWGVPHRVIQPQHPTHPCFDACVAAEPHCILGVGVEQVKDAVVRQLSNQAQPLLEEFRSAQANAVLKQASRMRTTP